MFFTLRFIWNRFWVNKLSFQFITLIRLRKKSQYKQHFWNVCENQKCISMSVSDSNTTDICVLYLKISYFTKKPRNFAIKSSGHELRYTHFNSCIFRWRDSDIIHWMDDDTCNGFTMATQTASLRQARYPHGRVFLASTTMWAVTCFAC